MQAEIAYMFLSVAPAFDIICEEIVIDMWSPENCFDSIKIKIKANRSNLDTFTDIIGGKKSSEIPYAIKINFRNRF